MAEPSEQREAAPTVPEAPPRLGLGPEEMAMGMAMPMPYPVGVFAAGEAEELAGEVAGLKLDGGEDRDGAAGGLLTEEEGEGGTKPREEEGSAVGGSAPHVSGEEAVPGGEEVEDSEVEKAWRGQQEWREEKEVAEEGVGEEEGEENGAQQQKGTGGKNGKFCYPQRPGEPDCAYYVKTGFCAFGANCKFNHPQMGRRVLVVKSADFEKSQVKEKEKEEHSSNMGQIQCKYYQTPGGCKYGSNCRYIHERERFEAGPELNFLGLPMRPGEKECPFYMRTGSCKFGSNCRFHHPNPTGMGEPMPVSGYHDNGSSQHVSGVSQPPSTAWSSQNHSNQSVSFISTSPSSVPGVPLPHQLHQNLEWNGYQAPPNSLYPLEGNKKYPSVQTMYKPTTNVNGHSGQFRGQSEEYPERPGQPECQFYMETGNCKYKSSCRFHHPKDRLARLPMCILSPMGLPLRPGQPVCTFYSRYGICKFGPTCRFDHPMDCGSSKMHSQTTAVNP